MIVSARCVCAGVVLGRRVGGRRGGEECIVIGSGERRRLQIGKGRERGEVFV